MKRFFTLFAISTFACFGIANAQATVESAAPQEQVELTSEIKPNKEAATVSNEWQARSQKLAQRKEHNKVEFNATLNASLSHFNGYWRKVNGNTNSLTGVCNIIFTHQYKKNKFVLDNKVTGKLGYTFNFLPESEGASSATKSQDEWYISSAPAYTLSKQWNIGGSVSLRSQFAKGYNGDGNLTSVSFAPAYLTLAAGLTYVCPNAKFPIKINISPISMNATYVTSKTIRSLYFKEKAFTDANGNAVTYEEYLADDQILTQSQRNTAYVYGLTLQNGNQRYEGGSSVQIDFDKTFGKKGIFRYRTTLYSFYGWINQLSQQNMSKKWNSDPSHADNLLYYDSIVPTVRWENTIDIKATKYFSTQLYFQLYYNKAQNAKVQTQTVLGVGLAYTFKNK